MPIALPFFSFSPNATLAGNLKEIEYILYVVDISLILWNFSISSTFTPSEIPNAELIRSTISFLASSSVSPFENPYTWIIGKLVALQIDGSASLNRPENTSKNYKASAGRFIYTWSKCSKELGGASNMSSFGAFSCFSFTSYLDYYSRICTSESFSCFGSLSLFSSGILLS